MDLNPESKTLPLDTIKMLAGVAAIPLVIFGVFLFIMYRTNYNRKERFDCCLIAYVGFLVFSMPGWTSPVGLQLKLNFLAGSFNACALGITIYMFRIRKHPEIKLPRIIIMYLWMLMALFFLFSIHGGLLSWH